MEKIALRSNGISAHVLIELTEEEAGALDALAGYGIDSFLEVFYKLGTHYMKPYEPALRSLFKYIRGESGISSVLDRAREARMVIRGEKKAITVDAYKRFEDLIQQDNERKRAEAMVDGK